MIDTILFDFGNVFIDLQPEQTRDAFAALGVETIPDAFTPLNQQFEIGQLTEDEYLRALAAYTRGATPEQVRRAWNTLLGPLPSHRIDFLQALRTDFRLFLLSNTDSLHISHFSAAWADDARLFFDSFDRLYLSYEMGLRKPDPAYFLHVLERENLRPEQCLFVDDRADNIEAAASLGIRVWHLIPGVDDVADLRQKANFR